MSQYTLPATGLACDMNAGAASAATQRVILADGPAAGNYVIEFIGHPDPTITAADTLTGTGHTIDVITL